MKKGIIGVLAIIIILGAIIFIATKYPFEKGNSGAQVAKGIVQLESYTQEQLVGIINCLANNRNLSLQDCIDIVINNRKPVSAVVTISYPAAPVRSMNYQIKPTVGAENVPVVAFNLKADLGAATLVSVGAIASGTPSSLSLYDGNTLLSTKMATATGMVIFDNLNLVLATSAPKTLVVKANYPANTPSGTVAIVGVNSAQFKRSNGSIAAATPSTTIYGAPQYLFTAGTNFSVASSTVNRADNGTSTPLRANIVLQTTPFGGSMIAPTGADIALRFTNGSQTFMASGTSVTLTPSVTSIPEATTAFMTVSGIMPTTAPSGIYQAQIASIRWKVGSITTTQSWGLEDTKSSNSASWNR